MSSSDLIAIEPDILGGAPVFQGTRVPVKTLFEYQPLKSRAYPWF